MGSDYISSLHNRLLDKADPGTRTWWEAYVKGSGPFPGVKMGDIRTIVHSWYQDQIADNLELDQQLDLALLLFEGQNTKEKFAGTLICRISSFLSMH